MSVWLTIPSARPAAEAGKIAEAWKERGYNVILARDDGAQPVPEASVCIFPWPGPYRGYALTVNWLIKWVMERDAAAEWFIAAGDDTLPDPSKTAEEIAKELNAHFLDQHWPRCWHWPAGTTLEQAKADGSAHQEKQGLWGAHRADEAKTFGVMQPTGDRWHEGVGGFANAPIDRVAGSAWYGREYCRRMYQGDGPLFRGYQHMFVDEEAQAVAEKMGVFWQRRDLVQKHLHWGRGETDKSVIELKPGTIPPHLEKWNTSEHWNEAKALFNSRKSQGFPGHEPIP